MTRGRRGNGGRQDCHLLDRQISGTGASWPNSLPVQSARRTYSACMPHDLVICAGQCTRSSPAPFHTGCLCHLSHWTGSTWVMAVPEKDAASILMNHGWRLFSS